MTLIDFFVPGIPKPGGSKTAQVVRRKGGAMVMVPDGRGGERPLISVRDDAKGNGEWKQQVAFFARKHICERSLAGFPIPPKVPLRCRVVFVIQRLASHYGTGRFAGVPKPSAPIFPTTKPDSTKLMRALEDALTGVLWHDDSQVVAPLPVRIYGDKPGARVIVDHMPRAYVGGGEVDVEGLFAVETAV